MASRLTSLRAVALRLSCALLLTSSVARVASAQVPINEPPVLPVSISVLPTGDALEAGGFDDANTYDILLIRNGVTISSILGAQSFGGALNVNGAAPSVCWAGVTPDIRPNDIVQYVTHLPDGTVSVIEQTRVRPITYTPAVVVHAGTAGGGGIVEVHGTAADLDGSPIPIANLEQRFTNGARFALNGRRTLRAGGGGTDGTLTFDLANNPTGTKWTVRYTGLTAGDVSLILSGDSRLSWLGLNPANANEFTLYENTPIVVPGPLAGTCTTPLEPLDITAPTAPTALSSAVAGPSAQTLNWSPSTDDVEVAGYEIRRDGVLVGATGPLVTTFTDPAVPAGAHNYTVVAFDNASPLGAGANDIAKLIAGMGQPWGNRSLASAPLAIVQPDVTPPTAPTTLTVAKGNGKAMPSWSGATDNVGVVSYGVYRNNVLIATVVSPTTTMKDSGLVTGTYNYSVDAVDVAGLRSPRTANVPVNVVFIPDTTPPTTPGGVAAVASPDVHGRSVVLSWNAATDSMGVTGYRLFRNGVQLALVGAAPLSFTDSALPTATYSYRVDAFDAANNHSAQSLAVTAVIANDPPLAPHALSARPSRDAVVATGYPAAQGPYVFNVLRGATTFTSAPINADGSGLVQVNAAGGGCWTGTTPNLHAGDVVRITNAAGIAEQTTVADLTTQFAIPSAGGTIVVHGTAKDAAGNPLPLNQIEQQLLAASGVFDKNGTATLRANATPGADGTLAYDALGSTHWTATYAGLSAADMARASGGPANVAAESHGVWLGRTPAVGSEQSMVETGMSVNGGPAAGSCVTPAESPVSALSFVPVARNFGGISAIPAVTSTVQSIEIDNTGAAPMAISAIYVAGFNPDDFTITSPAPPATLAAGGFFTVNLTFSPKALGARTATLCVACDAAGTTALVAPLSGIGVTDITPPTVPTGVAAVISPDLHGKDANISWNAASDSVGVTGYTVYRDGIAVNNTNAATLTYHDTNLPAETHVYRVAAFDLQNNLSAPSAGASVVVANEPPALGHVLVAHPSRDWVAGTGYPAASGPYVVTIFRLNGNGSINKQFNSLPTNADGTGLVQVNGAGGGCWSGTTPDLRAGDVVRITDAAGFADQTMVADVSAESPIAADTATIVVHGTAQDTGGNPLPLGQLQQQLVAAAGVFDANGSATLHASIFAGAEGVIAYDGPTSSHWTATYSGLSAADVARATGGTNTAAGTLAASESQAVWLGREPLSGTERTMSETGPGVTGGPSAPLCSAPQEAAPAAAFLPTSIVFDRQNVSPTSTSSVRAILFRNNGTAPMHIHDVRLTGLNAGDFSIVSSDAPSVMAPNTFCTIKVAFSPSTLGTRQAAVSLACDAANTTALSIPLSGMGWDGLVIADPGAPTQSISGGGSITMPDAGGLRMIPVYVGWHASPSPEVDHYELQQSVNGGAFVNAAIQPGSAPGLTVALPLPPSGAPSSYRFRVRAVGAGEVSNWITGGSFGLEPVDDGSNGRVAFNGTWSKGSVPGNWGGGIRTTFTRTSVELKDFAPFTIPGSIALITTMGPDRGLVSVRVDDKDSVVVDLYCDTLRVAAVGYVATNLAAGRPHHMLVRSLGQPGPLASAGRVDVDAFIVMNDVPRGAVVAVNHGGGGNLMSEEPELPAALSFGRISPNPAVGRTTLTFALPRDGSVRLDVMDVQGRLVQTLADGTLGAGEHRVTWDGRSGAGSAAKSGVYFAVLRFGDQTLVRRMIWMP